jgi:hypothetical protein
MYWEQILKQNIDPMGGRGRNVSGPTQVGVDGGKLLVDSLDKKQSKLERLVSRKEKYLSPFIAVRLQVVVLVGHTPLF